MWPADVASADLCCACFKDIPDAHDPVACEKVRRLSDYQRLNQLDRGSVMKDITLDALIHRYSNYLKKIGSAPSVSSKVKGV